MVGQYAYWAEWAIAHPGFAGIEKSTEAKIDNLLLSVHSAFCSFLRLCIFA
jgi:hypothetical protein